LPYKGGHSFIFGVGGRSQSNRTDTTLFDNNQSDVGVAGMTYRQIINGSTLVNGSLSFSGTRISKYNEVNNPDAGLLAIEENYSKAYTRANLSIRRKITNRYFVEGGIMLSRLDFNFFHKSVDPGNSAYNVIVNFSKGDRSHTYITQSFLYARQYISPKLFGFYGFHLLHFGLSRDLSFEPRLGLRWQFDPQRSLSFGFGKHSRVENLQYYLGREHQIGGNEVQLNKNLGFTRANHFVASFEHTFASSHVVKIETYYQQLYNVPMYANLSSLYSPINQETGFVTDSLKNTGRGKNYGVEVSFEKSFSNNSYYLLNGSLFQSTFSGLDNRERNTAFNGNYSIHLLAGKEFVTHSKRNRFGMNLKVTQSGGRRYVPIDLEKSIQQKKEVENWSTAFEKKLPDYFRMDFQLVYRTNRPHYSSEWRLDIQNITNHRNAAFYYYDVKAESIQLKRQIGFLPLISYRIEF
jgi:hypothetical protein